MSELKNPPHQTGPTSDSIRTSTNPAQWVANYGDFLFRHAMLRVRERACAEDLVQETFLAAWQARNDFAGRSSERAWLLGILKHKIAHYYRQKARQMEVADSEALAELEADQFKCSIFGNAHWSRSGAPARWPSPSKSLEQSEFWQVLHRCISKLPVQLARVFLLREMEECDTSEICDDLKIKPGSLFVMLHRSRLALRRCLEANWFGRGRSRAVQSPD